jgi:hypothetical protein
MFFVDELMNNDQKFEKVLQKVNQASKLKSGSESEDKSNEIPFNFESAGAPNMHEDLKEDEEGESDEEETLTMQRVRFSSLCILPSQVQCCSLDFYEKK